MTISNKHIKPKLGNPAVYGYKFVIFFLLYIYASITPVTSAPNVPSCYV